MLNAYSTLLLVIFLLVLIVLIVSALTVRKKKKVNARNYDKNRKDKAWLAGMKAYSKAYYIRNNKRIKSNARIAYKINRKNKLAAASALSKLRPGYVQEKFKKWYNRNKSSKQLKARRYSKLMYSQNPLLKKEKAREHSAVNYSQNPEPIKQRARRYSAATYSQNPEPIKQRAREHSAVIYSQNPQPIKQRASEHSAIIYSQNPQPIKQRAREHSAVIYSQNPEPQRKRAREFSAKSNKDNPEPKKLKSRESYEQNSDSKKNNALKRYHTNRNAILSLLRGDYVKNNYSKRAIARLRYALNKENKKRKSMAYYERNFKNVLYRMRSNYALSSPNNETKEYYHDKIMEFIVNYPDIVEKLITSINVNDNEDQSYDVKCRVASSILLESVLKNRIHKIGLLISTVNSVRKYQLKDESDFGERYHTQYSEPYYYDSAYLFPDDTKKINKAIPVDTYGKCHIAEPVMAKSDNDDDDDEHKDEQQDKNKKPEPQMLKWLCTDRCKLLTENDIKAIIEIRQYFDDPIKLLRQHLEDCDNDCPNYHYTIVNLHQEEIDSLDIVVDESSDDNCLMSNVVVYSKLDENNTPHCVKYTETVTELDGHPRICFSNDSKCCSKLRKLRSASVHYPNLRRLLKHFYKARKSHRTIDSIDTCLASGDVIELMKLRISENDEDQLRGTYYDTSNNKLPLRMKHLELVLYFQYATAIEEFKAAVTDQATYECISCERLLRRKSVTQAKNMKGSVWNRLMSFKLLNDPSSLQNKVLYICTNCKSIIKNDKVPGRCVLNGLQCEPIPNELKNLDPLSLQLIQRAKCFQTVVRLGTYTGKVPSYNSLKAIKVAMFHLPLPLEKTMATLDEVGIDSPNLPKPELYIIVNGQPTKSNTVWQTLVDVNRIKAALLKLKEINWLYRNVDDDTIDASSKEVIEVVSNTTCKMLEKATEADVQGLQAFTIRKLDTKIVKDSDISQYKLLNVREQAIDDRQSHLDLMCFPNLFPTGRFGENHPRLVKLDFSEYVKSRLLNKDSRFRKTSQFVFRLYRSKIKRDLNSGIYNYLKHTRYTGKSVAEIMAMIDKNDLELEGNLSTILQPVRGTNQYWYKVKGELKCMIREWGSPTFFLTLTCAEYDSADISQYLRTVNNVPQSYNIARLCTEDPISVSRQFSYKFHDFFNIVIMKWAVLGTVDHYYWKEYQMRGAPHYHIVLWIRDSPVLGRDSPEKVLSFIQE